MRFSNLTPGASSALIFCQRSQKVLFILRSDLGNDPGVWSLPGGHLEAGEDHSAAVYRECQEEIGRDLRDEPTVLLATNETVEPRFVHSTYAIGVKDTFKPRLNWEHTDYKWTSLEELPEPCSWSVNMLLNNEIAGLRLKRFMDKCRKNNLLDQ
jgi:uncharacterized protein